MVECRGGEPSRHPDAAAVGAALARTSPANTSSGSLLALSSLLPDISGRQWPLGRPDGDKGPPSPVSVVAPNLPARTVRRNAPIMAQGLCQIRMPPAARIMSSYCNRLATGRGGWAALRRCRAWTIDARFCILSCKLQLSRGLRRRPLTRPRSRFGPRPGACATGRDSRECPG